MGEKVSLSARQVRNWWVITMAEMPSLYATGRSLKEAAAIAERIFDVTVPLPDNAA